MKPATSMSTKSKIPTIGPGTLYFYSSSPEIIFMCTSITSTRVLGVAVHSRNPLDLGQIMEYANTRALTPFNGTITLE